MEERQDRLTDPVVRRAGAGRPETTSAHRPDPRVSLFEVSMGDYREFFFAAVGERSISITMFDPGDEAFPEPQTFTFARPYGWALDLSDDEALLQVWQSVGFSR